MAQSFTGKCSRGKCATLAKRGCVLAAVKRVRYPATVMKQPVRKRKILDYPDETEGSRLAAKARKMANKLTREERREFFRRAMVRIYGGKPKTPIVAGH